MHRALFAFCLSVLAVAPVLAQTPLPADASVHGAPNGPAIGTLRRGATVRTGSSNNGWTAVVVEGWMVSTRLNARRDTLDRTVTGTGTAAIRAADGMGQPIVAEVEAGTILRRLSDRNGWTQVRRSAWIQSAALQAPVRTARPAGTPQTKSPPAQPPRDAPAAVTSGTASAGNTDASAQRTTRATSLRASPGGTERAVVRAGASVETLARENGWARIRIEGWVPERDLVIADSSSDAGLSAADLRAEPAAHRGKIVRWDVQVISFQRADQLRRSLAPDEPYLLARGPAEEGAVLYLAIPPTLVERAQALPQLSNITITARVRDGRSAPVGAPLLDLISFTKAK